MRSIKYKYQEGNHRTIVRMINFWNMNNVTDLVSQIIGLSFSFMVSFETDNVQYNRHHNCNIKCMFTIRTGIALSKINLMPPRRRTWPTFAILLDSLGHLIEMMFDKGGI